MNTHIKKDWVDDAMDVDDLHLDLQNPRLPKRIREKKDTGAIHQYLFEHEDVLDIARSIATNGYHKSAVSIAYEEGGEMIVLDGNRRLAACQLLIDPSLAKKESDKRKIEALSKKFNRAELSRLKIAVAPSRKAAEKEIWDIHVNRLLKSWEQLQRLRMYKNLIDEGDFNIESAAKEYGTTKGKFTKELSKLFFYEWILELGGDMAEEKMREAGFNAIERLIWSKNGKKLLKYEVSTEGEVTLDNVGEAEQKLKKLIPYIIGSKKVPAQADKKYLEENVFAKIDPKTFSGKKEKGKKLEKKINKTNSKDDKAAKPNGKELNLLPFDFKLRRRSVDYSDAEALKIVEFVCEHFDAVADQIKESKSSFKIRKERDVQDLLLSILKLFFDDVRREDGVPSTGSSSSRLDCLLFDNNMVIETKTTLTRSGTRKSITNILEQEINDDLIKYNSHQNCYYLFFFIHDPEKKVLNPAGVKKIARTNVGKIKKQKIIITNA